MKKKNDQTTMCYRLVVISTIHYYITDSKVRCTSVSFDAMRSSCAGIGRPFAPQKGGLVPVAAGVVKVM